MSDGLAQTRTKCRDVGRASCYEERQGLGERCKPAGPNALNVLLGLLLEENRNFCQEETYLSSLGRRAGVPVTMKEVCLPLCRPMGSADAAVAGGGSERRCGEQRAANLGPARPSYCESLFYIELLLKTLHETLIISSIQHTGGLG